MNVPDVLWPLAGAAAAGLGFAAFDWLLELFLDPDVREWHTARRAERRQRAAAARRARTLELELARARRAGR